MALAYKRFGQELAKVSEPKDGNCEGIGLVKMGFDMGLVVVRLCSANGANSQGSMKMGKIMGFECGS